MFVSFVAAQSVPRTGDLFKRGLKESDFPRIKKLADGVYSYEQMNRIFPAMQSSVYPSGWIDVVKKAEAIDVRLSFPVTVLWKTQLF